MEAMEVESEGKFTYRQIYEYIKDRKYPKVLEKCNKLACVNVRLVFNPSIAKLAKWISDVRHRLAIIYYDINLHPRKDDLCNTLTCDRRPRAAEGHLVHPSILNIVKNSSLCSAKTQPYLCTCRYGMVVPISM